MKQEDGPTNKFRLVGQKYNLLFYLPRRVTFLIIDLFLTAISSYILATGITGLLLTFMILMLSQVVTSIGSHYLLKNKSYISSIRRQHAVTLFSMIFITFLLCLGKMLQCYSFVMHPLEKSLILSMALVVGVRLIIFEAAFTSSLIEKYSAAILQSAITLLGLHMLYIINVQFINLDLYFVYYWSTIYTIIIILASNIYLLKIDKIGITKFRIKTLTLFRAFMANWAEDDRKPMEELLERLGERKIAYLNMLIFKGKEKIKGIFVAPYVHPGPFRNIGSSNLPAQLVHRLKKKFNCPIIPLHGAATHKLDLTSEKQSEKVINALISGIENQDPVECNSTASPVLTLEEGGLKINFQLFSSHPLVTITRRDGSEDVDLETAIKIEEELLRKGYGEAIVVEQHNHYKPDGEAITLSSEYGRILLKLCRRASELIKTLPKGEIYFGGVNAKIEGNMDIGEGGISIAVIRVGLQSFAYVVVDGNNMIPELEHQIRSRLESRNHISKAIIMTTDSHALNAVRPGHEGYYAVGELTSHEEIVTKIMNLVDEAYRKLHPVKVCFKRIKIEIRVLGKFADEIVEFIVNTIQYTRDLTLFLACGIIASAIPLFILIL